MRVILTGGGTGGHIYPALAIAREFLRQQPDTELLFVGGERGLEAELVPREGFSLTTLKLAGIPRQLSLQLFQALWLAFRGFFQARRIVRHFHPDLVIGTGGYVCGPVVLAAALYGVPTAIQEQNVFPGLTNRVLGKLARRVFLGYSEAGRYFKRRKIVVTGNPIRSEEFKDADRTVALAKQEMAAGLTNILVFGGSQSARLLNQTFLTLLPRLLMEKLQIQVLIMTGTRDFEAISEQVRRMELPTAQEQRVKLAPYFYRIADAYAVADIVIARAGAISLAEIACFGIPAILVPYPYASGNHQEHNARMLEREGAARVIREAELTPETLWETLGPLLENGALRKEMAAAGRGMARPEAAATIVTELLCMVDKGSTASGAVKTN
jgi:UDP-N-acetylglucosamine--N-acetylmuramyl-(pentapeptide) pyrophosphoryl-undecaprenol N-acetylglucosamine transferase